MIGWLDLSAGASGDMLLGALVDAGVPLEVPAAAVAALPVERDPAGDRAGHPARARRDPGARARAGVVRRTAPGPTSAPSSPTPTCPPAVRDGALAVFERLAVAEGRVHRVSPEDVHFHEVGALDALADVVGVVAGFEHLGPDPADRLPRRAGQRLGPRRARRRPDPRPGRAGTAGRASRCVAGAGAGRDVHARPAPRWWPHRVDEWTTLPPMRVERVGTGAGGRDPAELPNVVRLVLGEPAEPAPAGPGRPGDQRRRPRPAAVARRPGRAVRRRAPPTPG